MYNVLISSKLANILKSGIAKVSYTVKEARDWDDMSEEEQRRYLKKHPESKRRLTAKPRPEGEKFVPVEKYDFMPIPEIQKSIKSYQQTGSPQEFAKLRDNFSPLIGNAIRRAVGSRNVSKEDMQDIRQKAALIFTKALKNADPSNDGILAYMRDTIKNQLMGEVRELFEPIVSIGPKHQKLRRKILKYIHTHEGPIDYEQMARDLSKDPDARNVTPELIANLLKSQATSLESEVGEQADDGSRTMHEVLGPTDIAQEYDDDKGRAPVESPFYETPEEATIKSNIKDVVKKSIESLDDPNRQKIIKLFYGMDGDPMTVEEISKEIKMPVSTVRRELKRAQAQLYGMKDIQKLREASNIAGFVKAFSENIKFAYVPKTVVKLGTSYIIDDKYTVNKYGSQLVCSCGKNCYHKDVVESLSHKK